MLSAGHEILKDFGGIYIYIYLFLLRFATWPIQKLGLHFFDTVYSKLYVKCS